MKCKERSRWPVKAKGEVSCVKMGEWVNRWWYCRVRLNRNCQKVLVIKYLLLVYIK